MGDTRDIFLSHATTDKAFVRALAEKIGARQVDGRNLTYWLDEAEIDGSVPGAINEGLEKSTFFAAIMTPSYFNSRSGWTDAEWHAALNADPDNRSKRFIPILASNCPHIPTLLRHFKWFDLREDEDGREFEQLIKSLSGSDATKIRRGREVDSAGAMNLASIVAERATIIPAPDAVEERLTCNLLPVIRLPERIYSAPLNVETRRHFRGHVNKKALCGLIENEAQANGSPARRIPPFRLTDDRIYSFYPIDKGSSIFRPIIAPKKCTVSSPNDYLPEPNSQLLLVSLLNMSIQSHAKSLGLINSYEPGRGWRFFFPPGYGRTERYIDWIPSRKTARRTVSKPLRLNDPKTEWLHAGAYLDIVQLAGRLFLKVRPTWLVTIDGRTPKSGVEVGRIVNKWTNRERNLSILYHIRFWTTILRSGREDIEARTHSGALLISSTPGQVQLPVGIATDRIDPEKLLDIEAKLIAASEHELVAAAIEFLAEEEWESDGEEELVQEA
jgi:TIR domain